MHVQICEYCRSRVERGREECKNCGAPVPQFHLATNVNNNPHFAWGTDLMNAAYNAQMDSVYRHWSHQQYGNIQNSMQNSMLGRQNIYREDPLTALISAFVGKR